MTKGKSPRGHHLIIIGRASILITILICRSLWRRRGRGSETTKTSLSSCYTSNTSVHLTHFISERVKTSIHALNLRHDGLEAHTTSYRGRRSRGGRSRRRRSCMVCMIGCLHPWPLRSKLSLAPPIESALVALIVVK